MDEATLERKQVGAEVALWVGAALVYRLLFLLLSPRAIDSADSIEYLEVARHFALGEYFDFSARIPVLYPALTALAGLVAPDLERAGIAVSLIASVLLLVPVYRLSLSMHGRAAARVAALVVCLWPWLIDYGCRVAPEALMSLLWFAAVWGLAQGMRLGGWRPVGAALLFFGVHLTRPEGVFLWLASPFLALALCGRNSEARLRRLAPFLLTSAVLLVASVLYMRAVTGDVFITPRANVSTIHYVFVERGIETAKAFLALFSRVLPIMMGPVLLAFAGAGLFLPSPRKRDFRLEALLLAFAAAQFVLAALSTYPEPRYIMNVTIALSLWSARGVALIAERAAEVPQWRRFRAVPIAILAVMMVSGLAANVVPPLWGRMSYQPVEYKIAGMWMKAHVEPGLILCRKPQVGFYAGMPSTGPDARESISEILERARSAGARYLVVDERYSTKMIPGLRPLLDPVNAPPGLRLLKDDLSPYPQARIVIYEIAGAS